MNGDREEDGRRGVSLRKKTPPLSNEVREHLDGDDWTKPWHVESTKDDDCYHRRRSVPKHFLRIFRVYM